MNLRRANKSFIKTIYDLDVEAIKKDNEPRQRIQNVAWPSESLATIDQFNIGECKRAMFYKILGVTQSNPQTVKNKYICAAGNLYESYHINQFKNMGMFVEEQKRIEFTVPSGDNKVLVCGKMDVIINDNGKRKAIEMKSISAWKAADITGNERTIPLPATRNLMQVMLYLHYLNNTDHGKSLDIDEVYLMYINRSDNSIFYYRVSLDPQGYAIITAIDQSGKEVYTLNLGEEPGYNDLIKKSDVATSYESRVAELKVKVSDIFSKFDSTYTLALKKILPPMDYSLTYDSEELNKQFQCGRISKIKYNAATKKGESIGDFQCQYCSFFQKCLSDSGVNLK